MPLPHVQTGGWLWVRAGLCHRATAATARSEAFPTPLFCCTCPLRVL